MNKRLACDFDGAVVRTMSLICLILKVKHDINVSYKEVDDWNFWKRKGLDKYFWKAFDFLDESDARLCLRPYDSYTIDVLRQLSTILGQPVDIVTCNHEKAVDSIRKWFESWSENVPNVNVCCIGRHQGVSKLTLPYDVFIDDKPAMAAEIASYPDKKMLLANAPWNQGIQDTAQVKRFHRWKEVIPLLYGMEAFVESTYIADRMEAAVRTLTGTLIEEDFYYK